MLPLWRAKWRRLGVAWAAAGLGLTLPAWLSAQPANVPPAAAPEATEEEPRPSGIYPLDQVEVGQEGVWRTVVAGNEIREFPLRVLGVVRDFIGPRQPAIIAEALDPENVLSGPVAGMSGSPVYIEGRLVGAYAYGYTWSKEQAIIGITPIEQMLPLLDFAERPPNDLPPVPGLRRTPGVEAAASARDTAEAPRPAASSSGALAGGLRPLPTPLSLGGFSNAAIELFRGELEALGFAPAASPTGQKEAVALDLQPGSPVAGVVMTGDFNAAATGTITWVEGERFLAFGHPFLQAGSLSMPMAGAEIVTVVRNIQTSFKLANVGEPAGELFQDRLSGIAGQRGGVPPMAQLRLSVDWEGLGRREFNAQLWKHPDMVPLMAAMATYQSLGESLSRERRETVAMRGRVVFADGDSIALQATRTGPDALASTALATMAQLNGLLDNPFAPLAVERVELDLRVREGWHAAALREVVLGDTRLRAGQALPVTLVLRDYWGEARRLELEVPLPARARPGETFELVVADASQANELLGRGRAARSANSLASWLEPYREVRPDDALYVFLLASGSAAAGTEVGGHALHSLPPSIRALLNSPATDFVQASTPARVLWEEQIPVDGTFAGYDRLTLTLE